MKERRVPSPTLEKCRTGIRGLDEITNGGLPKGRPTLVCGGAGSGKTLLSMEFLAHGIREFNEPGVFMTFEENAEELAKNFASLGIDVNRMIADRKLNIEYVHIDRSEVEETGEYDLEALFIRLEAAIASVKAKRLVLDTIEALFSAIPNTAILRSELRRLFRWIKEKGISTVVTGERGEGTLTRYGLEEYVADCVISLDYRISEQIATRRLRIIKYRGSSHGGDEYPFLIDEEGISVMPITSLGLQSLASRERVSTGIAELDSMMGGEGYYRGSSILVSGGAGTGKTSIAASFIQSGCARGEKCVWFAFEEAENQIVRNMRSIGIDLQPWTDRGLLKFVVARPSLSGLEMHLVRIHKEVREFKPAIVVLDPISNLISVGSANEVKSMLTRLIDFLKLNQVTAMMTHLSISGESTSEQVSSLVDTWLLLRNMEVGGERDRGLYIIKSRGMPHSSRVAEFILTDDGVVLQQPYAASDGTLLTGRARRMQEAKDESEALAGKLRKERALRKIARRQEIVQIRNAAAKARLEEDKEDLLRLDADETTVRRGASGRSLQDIEPRAEKARRGGNHPKKRS